MTEPTQWEGPGQQLQAWLSQPRWGGGLNDEPRNEEQRGEGTATPEGEGGHVARDGNLN